MACHQLRKVPFKKLNCFSSVSDVLHAVLDEGSVLCPKPNLSLSIKITQVRNGKKPLTAADSAAWSVQHVFSSLVPSTSKCQEPHVITLGFFSSEDKGRQLKSASSPSLCFGVGQDHASTRVRGTGGSPAASPTPAELQVLGLDTQGTTGRSASPPSQER